MSANARRGSRVGHHGHGTDRKDVLRAAVTPLASIFGSGFLIIVPILERSIGALAVVGMAAVCGLAWLVGMAVRHNVAVTELKHDAGEMDTWTERVERGADLVIVVAYVISVALYLRILAQFVVEYVSDGSGAAERLLAVAIVVFITVVGVTRGLDGLQMLERIALGIVLLLVAVLVVAFAGEDIGRLRGDGIDLPPVPSGGIGSALLVLGGIVITVQGFETIRYTEGDPQTRIAASRLAQLTATVVYILFVALATPLMGLGTSGGADPDLLSLIERVVPILALPLVLTAAFSQFSAATADTEASVGNLKVLGWSPVQGRTGYLIVGAVAALLAATLGTAVIIVVASRAFAAYYALQCLVAVRTSTGRGARLGYGALGVVMLLVTLLAKPAG